MYCLLNHQDIVFNLLLICLLKNFDLPLKEYEVCIIFMMWSEIITTVVIYYLECAQSHEPCIAYSGNLSLTLLM